MMEEYVLMQRKEETRLMKHTTVAMLPRDVTLNWRK